MPFGRENIGRAYVKILADGSGLPDSVRQEMEGTEPVADAAGKRDSNAYREGFEREFRDKDSKRITNALNEGIGLSDAIEKSFSEERWKKFVNRLRNHYGDAGVLAAHQFQEKIRATGDWSSIVPELENIGNTIRRIRGEIEDAGNRALRDNARAFATVTRETEKQAAAIRRHGRDVEDVARKYIGFRGKIQKVTHSLANFRWGKGARNDFINAVGIVISGLVKVAIRTAEVIGKVFESLGGALKPVADGIKNLLNIGQKAGEQAGKGFAEAAAGAEEAAAATGPFGLVAAIVALTAALYALPIALSFAISGFSALVGGALALVSALSFAVIGGLAPMLGALLPIITAVGVLGLAFTGLDKKTKASLANTYKPLLNTLKDLRKAASKPITTTLLDDKNVKRVHDAFRTLKPLVDAVSRAVAQVFESFIKGTESPGFKSFVTTMTKNLPEQIRDLGGILRSSFGFLAGLFRSLQPVTGRFLDNVRGMVASLSKWANSKAGQSSLKDFFDRAFVSAGKVWDIIKQVGVDIGKLLNAGKPAGDSLLDTLLKSLQDLGDWLDAHPDALKKWFSQGQQVAKDLGAVLRAIAGIIAAFDKPEMRTAVHLALVAIQLFSLLAAKAIRTILSPIASVKAAINGIKGIVAQVMGDIIQRVTTMSSRWLSAVQKMIKPFEKLPGVAGQTFRSIDAAINGSITAINDMNSRWQSSLKPKDATIDFNTKDYAKTIAELAAIRKKVLGIPTEVTVRVNAKLKGAGGDLGSGTATGGLFSSPSYRLIGEAGPEAVVPLARPLSQVDPAVRDLSAYAQGKAVPKMASGGVSGGKSVNVGAITVITPTKDPEAVAQETVNKLVGATLL